jgi:hypothetical protein
MFLLNKLFIHSFIHLHGISIDYLIVENPLCLFYYISCSILCTAFDYKAWRTIRRPDRQHIQDSICKSQDVVQKRAKEGYKACFPLYPSRNIYRSIFFSVEVLREQRNTLRNRMPPFYSKFVLRNFITWYFYGDINYIIIVMTTFFLNERTFFNIMQLLNYFRQ